MDGKELFERFMTDENIEKITSLLVSSLEAIGIKKVVICMLLFCIIMLSPLIVYIRSLNTSKIELLFLEKKESRKNDLANAFTLFWGMGIANIVLTITFDFIIVLVPALMLLLIFLWVQKLLKFINHRLIEMDLWIVITIICGPIMALIFTFNFKIDRALSCIFVALIQTFIFLLSSGMINSNISYVYFETSDNGTKIIGKWYAYRKLNEKYIMCGNSCNLVEATEIEMILIEDVLNGKYLIKKEKPQKEHMFIKTEKKKSTSEKEQ